MLQCCRNMSIATNTSWQVTSDKIQKAVECLAQLARPRRIILFGSRARGGEKPDSDVDLMVVERAVGDPLGEMTRLRRALSPLRIPVDVLVVSEEKFDYWSDTPGNVYFEARTEGTVLYEGA